MEPIRFVVPVQDIEEPRQPAGGLLERAFLDGVLADAPLWKVLEPAEADVRLTRVGDGVVVEGSTRLGLESACRRCLRPVRTDVPVAFTVNLVERPEPGHGKDARDEGERAGTFDEERAEEDEFDGQNVDLRPILREQVLLALPSPEPVCREDCKGLCPTCGADRNETDCGHGGPQPDPRWAALKDFKPVH